jgi:sigma-B regulation protein RsbU (phosphoserine phosphatase)
MVRRQGISLRYKILFMLTLLPLVMLGIYLYVAIQVFKNDKLAYIYDSSSAVARTLSSTAMTSLNSALSTAQPIMQEYIFRQVFAEISHGVIGVNNPIQWVAVYEWPAGNTAAVPVAGPVLERDGVQAAPDLAALNPTNGLLQTLLAKDRLVLNPFHDDRFLIAEKVADNQGAHLFLILAKMPDLADSFRSSLNGESYLVDSSGQILVAPVGGEKQNLVDRLGAEYFEKLKIKPFASGAEGLRSAQGEDLLASFAKVGFAGTSVISLTQQKEALRGVTTLIYRSLIFVMVLISATVIMSLFASGNLTSSISDLFVATQKIGEGDFNIRVDVKSNDEVGVLADSFNTMAAEVARLLTETAEKARMQGELNTARTVQETLFPPANAKLADLAISGFYEPASECGGDWWYYCQVGERIYLWIGDATGHGAPAALITSAARSASTIIERLNVEPKEALTLLNRAIYDVSRGQIQMTFFLASYDHRTRKLSYANASHEAPFLMHEHGAPFKKSDLIPLNEVNNPRLGQSRDTVYEQTEVQLEPLDRILFYTDGLSDIQNPQKKPWGEREFVKTILASNSGGVSVQESAAKLVKAFSDFRQQAPLIDDVTFFICKVEATA